MRPTDKSEVSIAGLRRMRQTVTYGFATAHVLSRRLFRTQCFKERAYIQPQFGKRTR
jgi:hypothetical protein